MSTEEDADNYESSDETSSNLVGFVFEDGASVSYMASVGVPDVGEIIEQCSIETQNEPSGLIRWKVKSRSWSLTDEQFIPVLKLTRIP